MAMWCDVCLRIPQCLSRVPESLVAKIRKNFSLKNIGQHVALFNFSLYIYFQKHNFNKYEYLATCPQ